MESLDSTTLEFIRIRFNDLVFELHDTIVPHIENLGNYYALEYPALDIIVWGTDRETLKENFSYAFFFVYKNVGLASYDTLNTKYQKIQDKLKQLISKITFET